MKILITGTAGFIGYHLAERLVKEGYEIIGLDIINDYYDINLKYTRLKNHGINKDDIEYNKLMQSSVYPNYKFIKLDLTDREEIANLFKNEKFDYVINLAAQAGVRHSLTHPHDYIESNIVGFMNILQSSKDFNIKHLIYASSSSVYGGLKETPFSEDMNVDKPESLYAATKKSNELLAYSYSKLYNLKTTGLRFFTVYGPLGRPDMAYYKFCQKILNNEEIEVYNNGEMYRDFTYIDDIINGISNIIKIKNNINNYDIFNIGNNKSIKLIEFVRLIEKITNKIAKINYLPLQAGDVLKTHANIKKIKNDYNYFPITDLEAGMNEFITWYEEYI